MSPSSAPSAAGKYVRLRLCPRARGLCLEVNLNPWGDQSDHTRWPMRSVQSAPRPPSAVSLASVQRELEQTLAPFAVADASAATEWRTLQQVSFSGDGEPTECPIFAEVVEVVAHWRALQRVPFFKFVLITNGTGLDRPSVRRGLRLFCAEDEIWFKMEVSPSPAANTGRPLEPALDQFDRPIAELSRRRTLVIQCVFAARRGHGPSPAEIRAHMLRLRALMAAGACIRQVHVCSISSPAASPDLRHLPLRTLSEIARFIRAETGLAVEVF